MADEGDAVTGRAVPSRATRTWWFVLAAAAALVLASAAVHDPWDDVILVTGSALAAVVGTVGLVRNRPAALWGWRIMVATLWTGTLDMVLWRASSDHPVHGGEGTMAVLAAAVGVGDPLDAAVVRAYWIGGPQLAAVEPAKLARRLRTALAGQPTGVLDKVGTVLAHHSFHVFAVYPWVRFLEVDPSTSLRILQACRVRWGLVQTVVDEHVVMASRPLVLDGGVLRLGDAGVEAVRWRRGGISLAPAPSPGQTVAAHWDWVCGSLDADEVAALAEATATTLETVNSARRVKTHAGGDA